MSEVTRILSAIEQGGPSSRLSPAPGLADDAEHLPANQRVEGYAAGAEPDPPTTKNLDMFPPRIELALPVPMLWLSPNVNVRSWKRDGADSLASCSASSIIRPVPFFSTKPR
jgi:hypothetical protein